MEQRHQGAAPGPRRTGGAVRRLRRDCARWRALPSLAAVRWTLAALLALGASEASGAQFRAPLYDSVRLNIGLNCRWERRCIAAQTRAMERALGYVHAKRPP